MVSLHVKLPHWFNKAFTGKVPFSNCIAATAMTNIITGVRPERPTHPDFIDGLWTLTQRCWEERSQDRPQIASIIEQLSVTTSVN